MNANADIAAITDQIEAAWAGEYVFDAVAHWSTIWSPTLNLTDHNEERFGVARELIHQRVAELVEFRPPGGLQHGLAGIEEDFRLEHEAVADHPDIGTVAQDRA